MTPIQKKRWTTGALALFFLVLFGGIGASALVDAGQRLYDGWRARDWVQVPATLARWDEAGAQYAYTYRGRVFTGTRLGTDRGQSSIDDWDERMDRRLTAVMEGDRVLGAWVNPEQPGEAILDREVRWKVVLTVAFIGAGFLFVGLLLGGLVGRGALPPEVLERLPSLKPKARTAAWHWAAALGWNFPAIPIAVLAIPAMWRQGEWFPVIMMSIFPIVGLGIAWSAVGATLQAARQGNPFELGERRSA